MGANGTGSGREVLLHHRHGAVGTQRADEGDADRPRRSPRLRQVVPVKEQPPHSSQAVTPIKEQPLHSFEVRLYLL